MGANAAHQRLDRMDYRRSPFGLFGEEPLRVDRGVNGPFANGAKTKPVYLHASTGMVWSLSQLTVTAVPVSSTSPVWFWMKARSGTSPKALVRMR